MVIKVSTLLAHSTVVQDDSTPILGGPLNTNNNPITNSGLPVTITGNKYPTALGLPGQVITTDGSGILSFTTPASSAITLTGDVTGSGSGNISTVISNTGVVAGAYGSASIVPVYIVNSKGQLTTSSNTPISITPSAAGLGNVANLLQVINAGGAPSISEGTGIPIFAASLGALYVDQSITNGNSIYRYNGSSWDVITTKLNLVSEHSSSFTAPAALGNNSIAIGSGAETSVSAPDSLAIGQQSLSKIPGSVVQANGRFASNGDAQTGRYLLRTHTINNLPTELFINGTSGGIRLTLPDDSTWTFKITVTGHRTDLSDGHAGYTAAGVIYRANGANTTSIQGVVQKVVLAESNPAWDININADIINGALKVTATGEAGKTIRWVALVETVEVAN